MFLLNMFLTVTQIIPREKEIGNLFLSDEEKWEAEEFNEFQTQLFNSHMVSFVLMMIMFYCQNIAYHTQLEKTKEE